MNSLENAIREAVEKGGYIPPSVEHESEMAAAVTYFVSYPYRVLLDPLFWSALGRARGWEGDNFYAGHTWQYNDRLAQITLLDDWENTMHDFIQHLIEGKDAESFFAAL